MRTHGCAGILLLAGLLCTSGPSAAQVQTTTITFQDFSDLSALTFSGSTATIGNPVVFGERPVLRLTNELGQSGGAFLTDSIPLADPSGFRASFSTAFSFQITDPIGCVDADQVQGADGIVFVVQTVSNRVGGSGIGIGYYGIERSLGVEFDTWNNGSIDRDSGNHVGINLNGDITSVALRHVETPMNDGQVWHAWVDYNGDDRLLEVRLSPTSARPDTALLSHEVDLPAVLQQQDAFVGFTSGTGCAGGDHDIRSWAFTNQFRPISGVSTEAPAGAPAAFRLAGNYPNPFNPGTTIRFDVPAAGPVALRIYDATGRLVRTLLDREMAAGAHEVAWDGRDGAGRPVVTGAYLCRMTAGGFTGVKLMMLVR